MVERSKFYNQTWLFFVDQIFRYGQTPKMIYFSEIILWQNNILVDFTPC